MKTSFLIVIFSLLILPFDPSYGQFFVEQFDYPVGDSLINHGWSNHSGSEYQIVITAGSLTYTGYPGSDIGNSIIISGGSGSREDVNKTFTVQTSGAVYAAFLVNVTAAPATQDYFMHFGLSPMTNTFRGKVFVQNDGAGGFKFGLSKLSATDVSLTNSSYTFGQTYLLVLKYEYINDPNGSDDVVKLYIDPDVSSGEPVSPDLENTDVASDIEVGSIALRQGSNSYTAQLDGIIVGTSWSLVVPVELTSFSISANNGDVILSWSTATEVNNSGFEIQRQNGESEFVSIAFVPGHGTTTESKSYKFIDANLSSGSYTYRLKQIDFNGTFSYSSEVNVDINAPIQFELAQNYPNPFNPSTTIKFSLPQNSFVTLKVYNALGQEVSTLVNGFTESGIHSINFDASNLNSGIYFYKLDAGKYSDVRKMTLIK
jgi:hypothetical protein